MIGVGYGKKCNNFLSKICLKTLKGYDYKKSKNIKEYKPICRVGEITIYKHKAKREWYISEHSSGHPDTYASSDIELKRFANNYYYLKLAHMNKHIYFESYIQQVLFEKYMKL